MKALFISLAAGLLLIACTTGPMPAAAADRPNILILGEDADLDTVPRNSRVFRRVLDALANQLHDEGFDIYDETAVTLDEFAQGRVRRTDAELIDIARSVQRPPIDLVVMFSIYASAEELTYTTKVNTRIPGRLLNVRTGQRLGNFEVVSPRTWRAPVNCDRECILETVGEDAKILAQDLGAALTIKLHALADGGALNLAGIGSHDADVCIPNAYTVVLDGFGTDEVTSIEDFLVRDFQGYKAHRPIYSSLRHQEYWYETCSDSARLNRNLRRMLEYMIVAGRVTFAGNTYTVEKITVRGN